MRRGQRGKQGPEKSTTMTDNILKSLVTEAVSLDREINEKSDRLKELKAELVAEARSRESELASTDGGGRRWTAEGSDGCIARVTFPAPTLKAKHRSAKAKSSKKSRILLAAFSPAFSSLPPATDPSRGFVKKPPRCSRKPTRTS